LCDLLLFPMLRISAIIIHNWVIFGSVKGGDSLRKTSEAFSYEVKAGNPEPLGVTCDGARVNFAIAVPDRKSLSLLLYRKESESVDVSIPISTSTRYGDIRAISIEGLPVEEFAYNYRMDGEIVTDPYTRSLVGRPVWGVKAQEPLKGRIPGARYDWEGDRPLELPLESCVLYAAHVRGLTMHESSKVLHKGTFLGVQEMIPYLKSLGINQLELMPIYEFEECMDKTRLNYWGYGAGYYFAPKASYGATDDPVSELKDLVKELHKNGIELVLDFYFSARTNPKLILDCIKYWVIEYHVDGVRVTGEAIPEKTLAMEPMLGRTKLFLDRVPAEDIYSGAYDPSFRHLAECKPDFQETARRLLRGEEGQVERFSRLVQRNGIKSSVVNAICNHDGFTLMDLVSYEEKHNEANGEENRDGQDYNFSWNCGVEGESPDEEIKRLRLRQMKNGLAMTFLSQGIPLLLSGDECGNTQYGNNNAYCQDNRLGWVCWENGDMGRCMLSFVRQLIAFRKEHPVLHQGMPLLGADYRGIGMPDVSIHGKEVWYADKKNSSRWLGILYSGTYASQNMEEKYPDLYVIYNLHWTEREFALPVLPGDKKWHLALHTGMEESNGFAKAGQEKQLKEQRTLRVEPHSILVLVGK